MALDSLALTWALSTISGYGIYGLQIGLQFLRRGGQKFIPTHRPAALMLPALTQLRLAPIVKLAQGISDALAQNPSEHLVFRHPVLHALGNNGAGFPGQDRVRGFPNIGCAAVEHKGFDAHAREVLRGYDKIIAISRWNESFLRDLNLAPVHLCWQGVDPTLFYPAPATGLWKDRFVVFSGGKFEFRKGQDIVVAAFRRFQARHPEALLVTCWQNLLPQDPRPFQAAGHCKDLPEAAPEGSAELGLRFGPWLAQQGLPPHSFVALPYTPNMLMPFVLRECDAAIFPNRCEGGTNLVAMEAMACGVPTFVADNTGQKDLVAELGCGAFATQRPVQATEGLANVEDWGESDADEVVAALERVYASREAARQDAATVAQRVLTQWDWPSLNEKLLRVVEA